MTKKVLVIATALMLFAALAPGALNAQIVRDTVYRQNFDSTWNTSTPPTNWTIIHTTTGGTPDAVTTDDWNRALRSGTNYMAQLYWAYETGIDRLISPQMDCSDAQYTSVWLRIYHYYNYYGGGYTAQIRGSSDNGSTYPEILLSYPNANYGPTTELFDITSWALGQNDVRIDFYGYGYSYNINYWNVDDFMVYGEWTEGGGEDSTIDLQMAAIIRPYDEEEAGVAFTPTCKIFNAGTETENAEVRCRITRQDNMQVVYDKVLNDFPCDPGYTTCSAFPNFTPEGGMVYKALFVVSHPEDSDPSNDNMEKRWSASVGEEVTPTEIITPADVQQTAFKPSAKFVEKAGIDEVGIFLHCRIEGPTLALAFEDSVTHDFGANEEYTPSDFPEVSALENGTYTVTFWATNKGGGRISVPPSGLSKNFEFSGVLEEPIKELACLAVAGNTVNYSLEKATMVSLKVYDASGQVVTTLVSGSKVAGSHTVSLNVKSGVYFVKLVTPEYSIVRKVAVIN